MSMLKKVLKKVLLMYSYVTVIFYLAVLCSPHSSPHRVIKLLFA